MDDQNQSPQEPQAEATMTFSDLEKMVEDNQQQQQQAEQDKGQQPVEVQAPPQEPPQQDKVADDFTKRLEEKGFKKPEELLNSYNEAHAKITKLSQERSAMLRDLGALNQFKDMVMRQQPQPQQQAPQPQAEKSLTDELLEEMLPKLQPLIDQRAQQKVTEGLIYSNMAAKIQAKRVANPEEFEELRPIMEGLATRNPQYEFMPNGIETLYDHAKTIRDQNMERLAALPFQKLMPDVPMDKIVQALRTLVTEPPQQQVPPQTTVTHSQVPPQAAYTPPSSGSTPAFAQNQTDYDKEIRDIMSAPKLTRDMPDQVLDKWWSKVQAQSANQPRR